MKYQTFNQAAPRWIYVPNNSRNHVNDLCHNLCYNGLMVCYSCDSVTSKAQTTVVISIKRQ